MTEKPLETVCFASEALPARERRRVWCDVVARKQLGMVSEPLQDIPFFADIRVLLLPGVSLGAVKLRGTQETRTREMLGDGNADFTLNINLTGDYLVSHRGKDLIVRPGEAVLQSMGETGSYTRPVLGGGIGLRLSRATLSALVPYPDDFVARPISVGTAAMSLLSDYARAVDKLASATPEALQRAAGSHLIQLVALGLSTAFGAPADGTQAGIRAAVLSRIKAFILRNLSRNDLSLQLVADRHGLSPRHVQRLFAQERTSYSEFILAERLQRVFDGLRDPRFAGATVAALAFDNGFGDVSTFYRYFRRRYNASPTDIRSRMDTEH